MQAEAAKRLIEETFNNAYDLEKFKKFIRELTKGKYKEANTNSPIPENFKEGIKSAFRIGEVKDDRGNEIDLVAVTLQKTVSLDRARTLQRNYIARYLKQHGKEAALVAFVAADSDSWRFSLVRRELGIKLNAKGKTKSFDEISPARRFSFLVGKGEKTHTAKRQLKNLLEDDAPPSLKDYEEAFNIEKVSDEFFEEYRELFGKVLVQIDEHLNSNRSVQKHFEEKDIASADFAKRLLGQIVFLYFLQKKGWLGVPKDQKWGNGSRTFLRDLYDKAKSQKLNFFNEYLEPLFYEALNRDHSDNNHYYKLFDSRIPFLNGGLFDAYHDYDWHSVDIELPNDIFSKLGKSLYSADGEGILDVFDRYNFTVAEDEPLEREVAIDPEMLGKVFERLLPANERGDKGTFYTPREIVHFMCQESLVAYLCAHISGLEKSEVEEFIRYGDLMLEHDAKVLRDGSTATYKDVFLGNTIQKNVKAIDEALAKVKVCDPAIGSGAFPVGMMTEIVRARKVLAVHRDIKISNYDLKRDTIHNSLYGVDIDNGAIEIAKLRLWLSLLVDEDSFDDIQALPNLDYKIMQGNSLLQNYEGITLFKESLLKTHDNAIRRKKELQQELSDLQNAYRTLGSKESFMSPEQRRAIRDDIKKKEDAIKRLDAGSREHSPSLLSIESKAAELSERLKKLHSDFFRSASPADKKKIRSKIEELEWQLIEASLKEDNKAAKLTDIQALQKKNVKPYFLWQLHFSDVFTGEETGFDIVIANPPYVDSEEMTKNNKNMRDAIKKVYKAASGNWDLFVVFIEQGIELLNTGGTLYYIIPNKLVAASYAEEIRKIVSSHYVREIRDYSRVNVFTTADVYPVTLGLTKKKLSDVAALATMADISKVGATTFVENDKLRQEGLWDKYFGTQEQIDLIAHIEKNPNLGSIVAEVSSAATVSEAYEVKKFLVEAENSSLKYFKLTNTGTIDPYRCAWGVENTQYIKDKYKTPIVEEGDVKKMNLRRFEQSKSAKLIVAGMSKTIECFLDSKGEYLAGKSTSIVLDKSLDKLAYVAGVLNSNVAGFWLNTNYKSLKMAGGYINVGNNEVRKVPVPEFKGAIASKISDMVYEAQKCPDNRLNEIKQTINELVYQLYSLTKKDIAVIEMVMSQGQKKAA
ncbi:MAG: Eco57I restriction-modification methylase domain-containing protein [Micavibrio sp.]|nr:Eco57I restriction-modification methylase domain-containing protein [Micavibrio sp.]